MRIALATALAFILATPALANDNAALFLAEHAAARAETPVADTAVAGTDEATETAPVPAPVTASHPANAFFLADAAARVDEAPAATPAVPETAEVASAAATPAAAGGSVQAMVTAAALRHGIDPTLAHAMAMVESGYRCSAVGRAGELGVMQVKPATARSVGVTGNLRDCATGIEAGMRYLRASIDRHGAGCGGISAYNMGIHRQASFCNGYGRKVMARMSRVQLASLD